MASTSTSRRRLGATYVACLLCTALVACMPGREPAQSRSERSTRPSQRIRILDGSGATLAGIHLRSRSATVSDALGIRIGRASSIRDRVVVRDRRGKVRLVLTPEAEGTGGAAGGHEARIEDGDGRLLGRLTVDRDAVRLYGPEGFQRGEVLRGPTDAADAEVFGAPGTDLSLRARATGAREVALVDPYDRRLATLSGYDLPSWIAAVMSLAPPEWSDVTPEAASEDGSRDVQTRLFQVGVLVYLRRLEPVSSSRDE
jgi:hypothetical protein